MRLPEQRLWDRMRSKLRGKGIRLERVENLVSKGRPDVDALAAGLVTLVELKAVDAYPARPQTPVLGARKGLSIDQRNWHLDWLAYGGRSLVLVGVGSRDVFAFRGDHADKVNSYNTNDLVRHAAAAGWDEVEAILKGKL